MIDICSYLAGQWVSPDNSAKPVLCAVTGQAIARADNAHALLPQALQLARTKAAPNLRSMTFHERAAIVKALATHLNQHKDELYALSLHAGSTLADAKVDIDGGITTMFVFASKAKR